MARLMAWRTPPGGVGGELVATAVVEFLHGPHQAGVALLNQVKEGHRTAGVAARDGDDQAQVGQNEGVFGPTALCGKVRQLRLCRVCGPSFLGLSGQEPFGEKPSLDLFGQLDFLRRIE